MVEIILRDQMFYYVALIKKFLKDYEEAIEEVLLAFSLWGLTECYKNDKFTFFFIMGTFICCAAFIFSKMFYKDCIFNLVDTFYIKYFNYSITKALTIMLISAILSDFSSIVLPFILVSCKLFLKPTWFGKEVED